MAKKHNFQSSYPKFPLCTSFKDSMRHPCIFVEGNNDIVVYNEVINSGWYFFPSPKEIKNKGVKDNIIEIIKNKNDSKNFKKKFVGIIDRDYDKTLKIESLYYTDYNDLESSALHILTVEEIYNGIGHTNRNISIKEFEQIYNKALDISKKLSSLWKYIYSINNSESTFKVKYLINYYDKREYLFFKRILDSSYNINYAQILELYNEHDKVFINATTNDIKNIMKKENFEFRGHDFFFVLGFILSEENIINKDEYFIFENNFIKRTKDLMWITKTRLYSDVKYEKAFK